MPGFAAAALVLVLIAGAVGGSLAMGAPVFAVPIVFAILVMWGGARLAAHRHRPGIGEDGVRGEPIVFDERDRRTLTPRKPTPEARRP